MSGRAAAVRLAAVFAAALLVTWGTAWLAARRTVLPRAILPALSPEDLRLAFVSADVGSLGIDTRTWPVYRGLSAGLRAAAAGAVSGASGVVARYRWGWIAWAGEPDGEAAPWKVVETNETKARGEVPSTLPPAATPAQGALVIVLRPREIFARAAGLVDALPLQGIPEEAVGTLEGRDGALQERWEIDCATGCLLAALDRSGAADANARGWRFLPPDPDTVTWFVLDPEAAAGGRPGSEFAALAAVERLLGLPLRDALARALAGPVVFALRDPREDGVPRLIAAIDLRRPEDARELLDRAFALGVLAEALEVTRYRGVVIGAWRPRADVPAALTLAVDGDVLLAALRPEDVREAIDRRRQGSDARPPAPLTRLGRGSWKSWSRSSFVAEGWEEVLSGRPAAAGSPVFEIAAVARSDGDRWIIRSEGSAPLLAAEALVPSARAAVRALRHER